MFIDNVVPMLRTVPLGFVPVSSAFSNVKHFSSRGAAVKIDKKVHTGLYFTPPLPWNTPAPATKPDMNDIKITLTDLSVNDVNLIMAGLGKLPLEAVVELWSRLKQQGEAQIKAAQEPVSAGLTD
jgi:hypothetical protein